MPSQQPLIAQGIGESYSIVPTPNQSLILDVELEDRPYVLGEPIWIRCSMINVTPDPVKIFYGLEAENHLMMDVRDSEGEVVPEIIQEKGDYGGHKIVTVAPGHRLVRECLVFSTNTVLRSLETIRSRFDRRATDKLLSVTQRHRSWSPRKQRRVV